MQLKLFPQAFAEVTLLLHKENMLKDTPVYNQNSWDTQRRDYWGSNYGTSSKFLDSSSPAPAYYFSHTDNGQFEIGTEKW